MPGTISVKLKDGCPANEVVMTLSGTAEPNGGDHYALVNWWFNHVAYELSIELEATPGVWVPVPSAFLFSHLGETYTIRARGPETIESRMQGLRFPYKVYGLYAPDWASVYGEILTTADTSICCDFSSEAADILSSGITFLSYGFVGVPSAPQSVPTWSYIMAGTGWLIHPGYGYTAVPGTGSYRGTWTAQIPSGNYSNTVTGSDQGPLPPQTVYWTTGIPYDWLAKEFTVSFSASMSESMPWKVFISGSTYNSTSLTHSATASFVVVKQAGESALRVTCTGLTASTTGGAGDGSVPSWSWIPEALDYIDREANVIGSQQDIALPCTGAVLRITPTLHTTAGGDGSGYRTYAGTRLSVTAVIIKGSP